MLQDVLKEFPDKDDREFLVELAKFYEKYRHYKAAERFETAHNFCEQVRKLHEGEAMELLVRASDELQLKVEVRVVQRAKTIAGRPLNCPIICWVNGVPECNVAYLRPPRDQNQR